MKKQTITQLRSSLFETFENVLEGETHIITHKNGSEIALVPVSKIQDLEDEASLHKNLSIGYAQALRGEGASSSALKKKLSQTEKDLRKKYG